VSASRTFTGSLFHKREALPPILLLETLGTTSKPAVWERSALRVDEWTQMQDYGEMILRLLFLLSPSVSAFLLILLFSLSHSLTRTYMYVYVYIYDYCVIVGIKEVVDVSLSFFN